MLGFSLEAKSGADGEEDSSLVDGEGTVYSVLNPSVADELVRPRNGFKFPQQHLIDIKTNWAAIQEKIFNFLKFFFQFIVSVL